MFGCLHENPAIGTTAGETLNHTRTFYDPLF